MCRLHGMAVEGLGHNFALVEELLIANEEHRLGMLEKKWLKYDVIIVDQLDYVPFTKMGSELLFQFFSGLYERASFMVTMDLEFTEWTVFLEMKR